MKHYVNGKEMKTVVGDENSKVEEGDQWNTKGISIGASIGFSECEAHARGCK